MESSAGEPFAGTRQEQEMESELWAAHSLVEGSMKVWAW